MYTRIKVVPISEVLDKVPEKYSNRKIMLDFDGYSVNINSERYHTFKKSGTRCVKCGLKAEYFALEKNTSDINAKSFHFNLYAKNLNDEEIMFTKDHILAKSNGGKNHIDNYQTMCFPCNQQKANLKNVKLHITKGLNNQNVLQVFMDDVKIMEKTDMFFTIFDVISILKGLGIWADLTKEGAIQPILIQI